MKGQIKTFVLVGGLAFAGWALYRFLTSADRKNKQLSQEKIDKSVVLNQQNESYKWTT
jgi:hypothetical protein